MYEFGNENPVTKRLKLSQELRPTEMLAGIDLFQLAGDRMRYLTERQTVIARNIANSDTPGYKAQDLAPFAPLVAASGTGTSGGTSPVVLATTNPGHLPLDASATASQQTIATDPSYGGEKPDGNTVSVEEQMVKSADVANAFAMASAVYAKSIHIMKLAVGGQ